MNNLISLATKNLTDIIEQAICLKPTENALVIYDTEAPLTQIVLEGYRAALPHGKFVDFNTITPEHVRELIDACKPGDLVVLLQSTNFRLNEFRFRIELFERNLKTIEHVHLKRILEDQFECYLNALAYDPNLYRPLGKGLKQILESASEVVVSCFGGTTLNYRGGMEPCKLNVGDYSEMKNVGGTYPIGEVFTEAKVLEQVNGEAMIFGYAGEDHLVRLMKPFKVKIEKGILTTDEAPEEFNKILDLIREDEAVHVREFGMGLNPAMGKHGLVSDITAFERQKGMHISLGAKHAIYAKQGLNRKKGRYHVDVFVDIETITADGKAFYQNGDFVV
jgi:aminopeptidase